MKKVMIIFLSLLLCGCAGTKVYFFGVDMEWVKDADLEDVGVMALGMATSFASHEIAHELTENGTSTEGHAGFFVQSLLATALTSFEGTRYSYFTRGVVAMNNIQIWSYPVRRGWSGGDIGLMDDGSKWWAVYSGVAVHNTLRMQW